MEVQEVTHTEKVYCCSNYPQTESTLIAKFDLVFEIIGLLIVILIISIVITGDEPVQSAQTQIPANVTNDPSMFFHWPRNRQLIFLTSYFVGRIIGIAVSILLLIGVKRKKHGYLLTWFVFTTIYVVISLVLGVDAVIRASEKLLLGIGTVASFFYKWYCLWIVKLLMSEIRAVHEGYAANHLDDGETEANNLVPPSDSFTVDKF